MNKSTLRQLIIAEMILADVNGRDHVSSKKRSMLEIVNDPERKPKSGDALVPIKKFKTKKDVLTPEQITDLQSKTQEFRTDVILGIAGIIGGFAGTALAGPTFGVSLIVGAIPDVVNGIRKVNRGDYFDAILDFLCAIPVVGEGALIFKGLNTVAKIAELIKIAKYAGWGFRGTRFIKTAIKFAEPANREAALHALDEMMSGDKDRIEVIAAGTKTGDVPGGKTDNASLGGIEYLQSLVDKEKAENEKSGVAESKNVSRLSLVDTLYGD